MVTAQFLNVGGAEVSLSSLMPAGNTDDYAVEIQLLDRGGYTIDDQDYIWVGGEWCDIDENPITEDVTFAPGQALWVFADDSSTGLQSAGKVGTSDIAVQLRSGAMGVGNPFPVSVSLQDLLPVGNTDDYCVEIQVLDRGGYTIDEQDYIWVGGEWCDIDENPITETVTFAPGEGLWVFADNDSQYLRFPAPEL